MLQLPAVNQRRIGRHDMQLEVKVALVSGAASGVETERAGYDAPLNAGGAHLQCAVALVQRQALMVGELCE